MLLKQLLNFVQKKRSDGPHPLRENTDAAEIEVAIRLRAEANAVTSSAVVLPHCPV